jgi:hypothetical protein
MPGETRDPNDMENSIRCCVNSLIRLFFYSDECASRCRDMQAVIDEQIDRWDYLSGNAPERPSDSVIDRTISDSSIPAWDASCERSFSLRGQSWGNSIILRRLHQITFNPEALLKTATDVAQSGRMTFRCSLAGIFRGKAMVESTPSPVPGSIRRCLHCQRCLILSLTERTLLQQSDRQEFPDRSDSIDRSGKH